ncbi:MAG: efflux RND transporter periplasmic adaptor subunit [Armatimonadetes bacterium]|nr:efflux RND transporter periplasmic adaptor subunit [Armatimonadota bacterium]MDE2206148.1 efflux RND transporter periplasmic adaptor subunit [Armatimonadota bacterium]
MKSWLVPGIAFVCLAALIAWRLHFNAVQGAIADKQRVAQMHAPVVVGVADAVIGNIAHQYEGIGSVESPFDIKISARVTARILYLQVRQGDRVKAGQVLVRLDPGDLTAAVTQQQAALAEARYRLAQAALTQNSTNVGVSTQISQGAAGLASAQANQMDAERTLDAQRASAEAAVTDAKAKLDAATAQIGTAQAAVAAAKANMSDARAKLDRTTELYRQSFVAAQDVDDARAAFSVTQSAVNSAIAQVNAAKSAQGSMAAELNAARQNQTVTVSKAVADLAVARAATQQAAATLKLDRANRSQAPAYEANIAALRAAVTASEAQLSSAEANLSDVVIRAPLDGTITERDMDPGAMATPGAPIVALQTIHQVWVSVATPEEVTQHMHIGMPATADFDALPGRTYHGAIVQMNPAGDVLSRQFTVKVAINNTDDRLKPGMFGRVTFAVGGERGVLLAPHEAIQVVPGGGSSVTVVGADGIAHKVSVTTGDSDSSNVEVTSGLAPGDRVVVMSAAPVKDGSAVKISGGSPGGSRKQAAP